jgi:hypothetical protein
MRDGRAAMACVRRQSEEAPCSGKIPAHGFAIDVPQPEQMKGIGIAISCRRRGKLHRVVDRAGVQQRFGTYGQGLGIGHVVKPISARCQRQKKGMEVD